MLKPGTKAPDFEGVLDDGSHFRLSEALSKQIVVLYFYPKDFTGGCTREACSFRDNFEAITGRGAMIVGVSADDEESHSRFREKHSLPFPLLADTGKSIVESYDAKGLFGIGIARITYVIDRAGTIRAAFRHDVLIGKHVPRVLEALDGIAKDETPATA